jgi:methionyl-tRNA formyltransferase
MRVAFLGTDGLVSCEALGAIARDHRIVAIGRPAPTATGIRSYLGRAARTLGLRATGAVDAIAREQGVAITQVQHRSDPALLAALRQSRPDVLCVAVFPWLLGREILTLPHLGAVNVHTSLLPRHRGPLPLFWIYHADDRQTGVTVHWMEARADSGAIVSQASFPLARGESVEVLNARNARVAGPLLADALSAIADGSASRLPQEEAQATAAPFVRAGATMIDFEHWDAERIWHFLRGLYPRFIEPLTDESGAPVPYRAVSGYSIERHRVAPGTVQAGRQGANLYARDGIVQLAT